MIEAGTLDRRLTLLRASVVLDEYNEQVATWATLATVWGSKADVRDTERIAAAAVGASVTTRFRIRWSAAVADLSPADRLVCAGITYDIGGVKEIDRRRGLEITATAQAPAEDDDEEEPASVGDLDLSVDGNMNLHVIL